jgi:hypothetical protein
MRLACLDGEVKTVDGSKLLECRLSAENSRRTKAAKACNPTEPDGLFKPVLRRVAHLPD